MEVYLHLDGHSYNETMLALTFLEPDEVTSFSELPCACISING